MTKRHREKPTIIVRKERGRLSPISAYDDEQLDALPAGAEFDLKPRARRSIPLHRTYWKALAEFNAATEMYPTTEHLHDAIKRSLGYVEVRRDLAGREYEAADSTSFDAMRTDDDFRPFFDAAMRLLAETGGFDPLQWLEAAA